MTLCRISSSPYSCANGYIKTWEKRPKNPLPLITRSNILSVGQQLHYISLPPPFGARYGMNDWSGESNHNGTSCYPTLLCLQPGEIWFCFCSVSWESETKKKKHLQVREQSVDGVRAFRASETEFNKGTELFVTSTVIKWTPQMAVYEGPPSARHTWSASFMFPSSIITSIFRIRFFFFFFMLPCNLG